MRRWRWIKIRWDGPWTGWPRYDPDDPERTLRLFEEDFSGLGRLP